MQRNIERDKKLAEAWKTGRYKTMASLARVFKVNYNAVKRAVERDDMQQV